MTDLPGRLARSDAVTLVTVPAYRGTRTRAPDAAGRGYPAAKRTGSPLIMASRAVTFTLARVPMGTFRIAIGLFGIGPWLRGKRARTPGAAC